MEENNHKASSFSTLKTKLTLRPGQRGTKQLQALYGDRLLCVRYRYDAQRKTRVKTVELIVEERAWSPTPGKRAWNAKVGIRILPKERSLQRQVKAAGGKWNLKKRLWELSYKTVVELGLEDRMGESDQSG